MSIVATGWHSTIVQAMIPMVPEGIVRGELGKLPTNADRYVFSHGLLRPQRIEQQSFDEIAEGFWVNYASTVRECRRILAENMHARICIIGSESGVRGSFDDVYAVAKAGLHFFVETEPLQKTQQLVAISPGIIGDAGMTTRRTDADVLERRRQAHPKGRFITSSEVATMVCSLLYIDTGFTTGTVIRMHGGGR